MRITQLNGYSLMSLRRAIMTGLDPLPAVIAYARLWSWAYHDKMLGFQVYYTADKTITDKTEWMATSWCHAMRNRVTHIRITIGRQVLCTCHATKDIFGVRLAARNIEEFLRGLDLKTRRKKRKTSLKRASKPFKDFFKVHI